MPPAPETTSLAVLEMARAGRFEEIRELFAPGLRSLVSAEALQSAWQGELDRLGPVSGVGTPLSEAAGPGMVLVRVPVACQRGELTLVVTVAGDRWLAGLQLAPASAAQPNLPWEPPAYANPGEFDEQELTLGSGRLSVPGTLSLPHRPGPLPAVVLLSGSGPLDRDGTMGRNRPYKDLAWGLASLGVAVLRFDKVTYAHGAEVKQKQDFTLADEYLPDAVAAVKRLGQLTAIDQRRVFLIGHSLGGTVAPRVAAAAPSVAGLVLLAGGAQPLHWAAVRQVRYLASLDSATVATSASAIVALTEQAARVDSAQLSTSTPAGDLPFGVPAPYWLDLRAYDPVALAAQLAKPMLILQGGRDYQATVADDLVLWQAGLASAPGVTIRIYPLDNHLFFPGTGPSTPAEYEPAQHLDAAVVADIASWLETVRSE